MTADQLEQRRQLLLRKWSKLAGSAERSGNTELATIARTHATVYEQPPAKVGDWIAGFTKAFGIPPCAACTKRQAALNAVDTNRPPAEVFRDLFRAVVNP